MNIPRPDGKAPSVVFRQTGNGFENANAAFGFRDAPWSRRERLRHLLDNLIHLRWRRHTSSLSVGNDRFAQLADLAGDGTLELIVYSQPSRVYCARRYADAGYHEPHSLSRSDVCARCGHRGFRRGRAQRHVFGTVAAWALVVRFRQAQGQLSRQIPWKSKACLFRAIHMAIRLYSFEPKAILLCNSIRRGHPRHERAISSPKVRIGSRLQPAGQLSFTVSPQDAALTGSADVAADSRNEVSITYDTASRHWVLRSPSQGISPLILSYSPVNPSIKSRSRAFSQQAASYPMCCYCGAASNLSATLCLERSQSLPHATPQSPGISIMIWT